jgi:hypothetical protein
MTASPLGSARMAGRPALAHLPHARIAKDDLETGLTAPPCPLPGTIQGRPMCVSTAASETLSIDRDSETRGFPLGRPGTQTVIV